MASAVTRSAIAQLESSVMLCQAHAYALMDGPAGVVTDFVLLGHTAISV